jgi:hypothetical protein
MKRLVVVCVVLLTLTCIALPDTGQAGCVIEWWGDMTGWIVTNETGRTTQARHETFLP